MSDALKAAIDEVRQRIQEKVEEIKSDPRMQDVLKLHRTLNGLQEVTNEPCTPLEELFGLSMANHGAPMRPTIRFDEFAGRGSLEAAKMYLRKFTEARPFKEIVNAILEGGGKVDSEDQLKVSLSRSTLDIVKIGDSYGLIDHYPHIKAQRTGKPRKSVKPEAPTIPVGQDQATE